MTKKNKAKLSKVSKERCDLITKEFTGGGITEKERKRLDYLNKELCKLIPGPDLAPLEKMSRDMDRRARGMNKLLKHLGIK